jgi:ABC-type transporter MlaC component
MKKILVSIAIILLFASTGIAATQSATHDANKQVHWVAPRAIFTINADTAVDSDYLAVAPETDATFYFDSETANTFTVDAYTIITIPKNRELKFTTQVKCLGF